MKSLDILTRSRSRHARHWPVGGNRSSPARTAGNALLTRLTTGTTLRPQPPRVAPSRIRSVYQRTRSVAAQRIMFSQNSVPARPDHATSITHQKIVDPDGRAARRLPQTIISERPTITGTPARDTKTSQPLPENGIRVPVRHMRSSGSLRHTRVGVAGTPTPRARDVASMATAYSVMVNTMAPSRAADFTMGVPRIAPMESFSRIAPIRNAGMPLEPVHHPGGSQSQWDREWADHSPSDPRYAKPECLTDAQDRNAPPDNAHPAPSAPTQGIVYLDGQALGHWMAEHLGQLLARPDRGPSGIDPRVMSGWTPLSAAF